MLEGQRSRWRGEDCRTYILWLHISSYFT